MVKFGCNNHLIRSVRRKVGVGQTSFIKMTRVYLAIAVEQAMNAEVKIRRALISDAEACLTLYRPSVDQSAISFEDAAPTLDEMAARIAKTSAQFPWLIAEDACGAVAGYAYASPHRDRAAYRWTCEVSIYVAKSHHRRGVANALYSALLEFLGRQGYQSALAGITLPNPESVALHEKFGFKKIAVYQNIGFKNGEWRDVGWWQLQIGGFQNPPQEPESLA